MEAAGGDGGAMDHMADGGEEVFFRGSISEAIVRAQGSDLVLIVFVSGENEESVSMELTTFRDAAVLDEVKKESLILRLQEGSTDAAYFQAIFPVRRVPTITFLGLKGTLLGQLEGYQDAEKFLTALRNVQLQRVAAKAMVALLSSANLAADSTVSSASAPEPPTSTGNSTREDIPVQSSSTTVEGSSMDVDLPEPTEVARSPVYPEAQPIPDAGSLTVESRDGRASGGSTAADTNSLAPKPEPVKSSSPEALKSSSSEDSKSVQNQAKTVVKQGNGKKTTLRREPSGGTKPVKVRTGPFLLQVRLTNGETIQGTFESYQLLRDVKNFIDLQRTDGSMEFRLAIPFPRKLFSEEDMDKTLSKLDIGPRSALILIASDNPTGNPSHSRASANSDADSSSQSEATTAGGSYVGKFLSFLSPYVYGRPAAPQQTPASHSNASPATTRALQEGAQPPMSNSSRPEPPFVTPMNAGSNQENTTLGGRLSHRRGGGANVHTLRGGDEEGPSPGNTYWNGNSTQFGGNDEAKED
ncbi:hypothetical protein M758_12G130700 [Ceratodon purpureus]|nr:hypothetical protein M758_12G130700 [Ceratodon purpureus]